jgi:gliding motility-associated-like protein
MRIGKVLFYIFLAFYSSNVTSQNIIGGHFNAFLLSKNDNFYTYKLSLNITVSRASNLDSVMISLFEDGHFHQSLWMKNVDSTFFWYNNHLSDLGQLCFNNERRVKSIHFISLMQLPVNNKNYTLSLNTGRGNVKNLEDSAYSILCTFRNGKSSVIIKDDMPAFLGTNDTNFWAVNIANTENDSIVFRLEPVVNCIGNNDVSIKEAAYNAGYSALYPMGLSGYCSLSPLTGLLKIKSKDSGEYALRMVVEQYDTARQLAGYNSFDIIVRLINFTNWVPNIMETDSFPHTVHLNDGDDTVIHFGFYRQPLHADIGDVRRFVFFPDTYFDSFSFIKYSGDNYYFWLPGMTGGYLMVDKKCGAGRIDPYRNIIRYYYNGSQYNCPSFFTDLVMLIYIDPVKKPVIQGETEVCFKENEPSYYILDNREKNTLIKITGGQYSMLQDSVVKVFWDSSGNHVIKAVNINKNGCSGDTATLKVNVRGELIKPEIAGELVTCAGNVLTYIVKKPGRRYNWIIDYGSVTTHFFGDTFSIAIQDNKADSIRLKVFVIDSICTSDTAYFVTHIINTINEINGYASVCPFSTVRYWINASKYLKTEWSVTGGKIVSNNNNGITVKWENDSSGLVYLNYSDSQKCRSGEIKLLVSIGKKMRKPLIEGNALPCPFQIEEYKVLPDSNFNFTWNISGGYIVKVVNSRIEIFWDNTGKGYVSCYMTSKSDINCTSQPDTFYTIIKSYSTVERSIVGKDTICSSTTEVFYLKNAQKLEISWFVDGQKIKANEDTLTIKLFSPGQHIIRAEISNAEGCSIGNKEKMIYIPYKDNASKIIGPTDICFPEIPVSYKLVGVKKEHYKWLVKGGTLASESQSRATVIWDKNATQYIIRVITTERHHCADDTFTKQIYLKKLNLHLDYVSDITTSDFGATLYWKANNIRLLGKYIYIYRATDNYQFKYVDSALYDNNVFTDLNANQLKINRYKILALNSCGLLESSDTCSTILLQKDVVDSEIIKLFWSQFRTDWSQYGIRIYLYPLSDKNEVYEYTANTFFTDSLEGEFQKCYRAFSINNSDTSKKSWSNQLCITNETYIYFPNAFTPNSDGVNDTFIIAGSGINEFDLRIYNQWGELIFVSNQWPTSWDGKFKGKFVEDGVYFFIANVSGKYGRKNYKGNIFVIR